MQLPSRSLGVVGSRPGRLGLVRLSVQQLLEPVKVGLCSLLNQQRPCCVILRFRLARVARRGRRPAEGQVRPPLPERVVAGHGMPEMLQRHFEVFAGQLGVPQAQVHQAETVQDLPLPVLILCLPERVAAQLQLLEGSVVLAVLAQRIGKAAPGQGQPVTVTEVLEDLEALLQQPARVVMGAFVKVYVGEAQLRGGYPALIWRLLFLQDRDCLVAQGHGIAKLPTYPVNGGHRTLGDRKLARIAELLENLQAPLEAVFGSGPFAHVSVRVAQGVQASAYLKLVAVLPEDGDGGPVRIDGVLPLLPGAVVPAKAVAHIGVTFAMHWHHFGGRLVRQLPALPLSADVEEFNQRSACPPGNVRLPVVTRADDGGHEVLFTASSSESGSSGSVLMVASGLRRDVNITK